MLKVECPPLPENLQEYLAQKRQRNAPWRSLGDSSLAREIRDVLRSAFHGKCGYCEKIEAQSIDHFVPKSIAEMRWIWENFVLACDVCQSKKHGKLPFDSQGWQMVNPRDDDPIRFLHFAFETGVVTSRPDSDATYARGQITIQILALDKRANHQEERRRRFLDILGLALRVVQPTSDEDAENAWQLLADHLKPKAPYLGMVRQLLLLKSDYSPLVAALRQARPEIDEVVRDWCLPFER